MNAIASVAALIVSVIALWTTAQISGLEDYLHSEISRRNADLSVLAKKSGQLEVAANERQSRLEALQLDADRLLTGALQNERRLSESSEQLADLRDSVRKEREKLVSTEALARERGELASQQARDLDLLHRRKIAERFRYYALFFSYRTDEKEADGAVTKSPPIGEQFYSEISKLNVATAEPVLQPYFAKVLSSINGACPDLRTRSISSPARPAHTPLTVDYSGALTQTERNRRFERAQKEWARSVETEWEAIRQAIEAQSAARNEFTEFAAGCVCASLADQRISKAEICARS